MDQAHGGGRGPAAQMRLGVHVVLPKAQPGRKPAGRYRA
jgi:hypothetical protein